MLRIAGVGLDIFILELFFLWRCEGGKQGGRREGEGKGWGERGGKTDGRWELAASC